MVRIKKRYFVLDVQSEAQVLGRKKLNVEKLKNFNERNLANALKDLVGEFHGDLGRATVNAAGLRVVYANADTGMALIQTRHGTPHKLVASVIPFLTKLDQKEKIVPRLVYTGATVRNCYQKMEEFQKGQLDEKLKDLIKEEGGGGIKIRQIVREKLAVLNK